MHIDHLRGKPLTPRETQILTLLSEGVSYEQIQKRLIISLSCLYQHIHYLKRKTGIENPLNMQETGRHLLNLQPVNPDGPTRAQRAVLHLLARGCTYRQIAKELGKKVGTVMNTASQGRKRAGLMSSHARIRAELRQYLAQEEEKRNKQNPMSDPMF